MAKLSSKHGKTVIIKRYHIFGRDPQIAQTVLNDPSCSNLHASIFFKNERWYFQDHSLNGSLLNNKTIRNRSIPLDTIKTVKLGNKEWEIKNLNPPCSFLADNKGDFIELHGRQHNVEFNSQLFLLNKNKFNNWLLRKDEKTIHLKGGETLIYKNVNWKFIENDQLTETIPRITIQVDPAILIEFLVSQNYENIKMNIFLQGVERVSAYSSCNFTMYFLAQQSLQDQQKAKAVHDIGWVEVKSLLTVMCKELGRDCDEYYLNLQIYRIRNQLKKTNPELHDLIQRRKGEIRIKPVQILIKGNLYEPLNICNTEQIKPTVRV